VGTDFDPVADFEWERVARAGCAALVVGFAGYEGEGESDGVEVEGGGGEVCEQGSDFLGHEEVELGGYVCCRGFADGVVGRVCKGVVGCEAKGVICCLCCSCGGRAE